jgi:hypothetical protein
MGIRLTVMYKIHSREIMNITVLKLPFRSNTICELLYKVRRVIDARDILADNVEITAMTLQRAD